MGRWSRGGATGSCTRLPPPLPPTRTGPGDLGVGNENDKREDQGASRGRGGSGSLCWAGGPQHRLGPDPLATLDVGGASSEWKTEAQDLFEHSLSTHLGFAWAGAELTGGGEDGNPG